MRASDRERRLFDGLWGIARNSNSGWSSGFRWGRSHIREPELMALVAAFAKRATVAQARRRHSSHRTRPLGRPVRFRRDLFRRLLRDCAWEGRAFHIGSRLGNVDDYMGRRLLGRAWADGPHRARELGLGPSPSPSLHVSIERNPTAGGVVPHQRSDRAGNRRATIEWRPR
jgi:hypothetical protein